MIDRLLEDAAFLSQRRQLMSLPLAICLSAVSSAAAAQGVTDGVLRAGVLSHYKPFSFVDGHLQGFDVDVLKRLATVMKVELLIQSDSMAVLQKKLAANDIVLIGNQLLTTTENRRLFDFVKSYASNQLVCIQHEEDTRDFLSLDDLYGKKLGVLANTGLEEQARGAIGKTVMPFVAIDQAFKALAEKKIDAVLEESLIADFYIERHGWPIKITSPFAPPMSSGWVVRKGNKDLTQRLSAALQTLLSDGSFREISVRWFGYDVSRPNVSHSVPR